MHICIALPIARLHDSDTNAKELETELQHMFGICHVNINTNNSMAYIEFDQNKCTEYDIIHMIRIIGFELDVNRDFLYG